MELHCLCSRISWAHKRTWRGEPGHAASSPVAKSLQGHLLGKDGRSAENPPFPDMFSLPVSIYIVLVTFCKDSASWIIARWDIFHWYEICQNIIICRRGSAKLSPFTVIRSTSITPCVVADTFYFSFRLYCWEGDNPIIHLTMKYSK